MGFSLQAVGPDGEERDEYLSLTTTAMSAVRDVLRPWTVKAEGQGSRVMFALSTNQGVRLDANTCREIASNLNNAFNELTRSDEDLVELIRSVADFCLQCAQTGGMEVW